MQYSPGSDYTGLPHNLQGVDRSAPGTGIQAFCGIHGCLGHQLGNHVQRTHSVRGMDWSPTVLAYQLPRVSDSKPCPEPQRESSGQGHYGPYGQHSDCCIYQPARWFMLLPHVATRLPPPPLESEASGVSSCHPGVFNQSRVALPGEWRLHPQAVQLIWCLSGRPVCISVNHPLPMIQLPI